MAFGLNILGVGSLLVLANGLPGWCLPDEPPEINVIPVTEEVTYDYAKNTGQLSQFDIAHSPYEPGTPTRVKGLHSGKIKFTTQFEVATKLNQKTGQVCMYYKTIDVNFHIDPTIYITNEHQEGTCEHAAIHEHEMKHLMTDRQVINDYSAWIGEAIYDDLHRYGYIWGPLNREETQTTFDEMKTSLTSLVKPMIGRMTEDRAARQAAIDTIEEYERVSNACR